MTRLRQALLLIGLVAVALVPSSQATHRNRVFSGQWTTNTGGVGFRWVTGAEGAPAIRSLGGTACPGPSEYYRGGYVSGSETGKVTGCTVGGPKRMRARYRSDDGAAHGTFDVTFVPPNTFKGSYHTDAGANGPYTGAFKAHFGGDGASGGGTVGRFEFRITWHLRPAGTTPPNCPATPGIVRGHGNAIVIGGTINAGGLTESEEPFLARCRTTSINLRVRSATLDVQRIDAQHSVRTVRAVVEIEATGTTFVGNECSVGTQGSLTVVDSDVYLRPQNLYADSFSLGGWHRPCRGHRHSWSQSNKGAGPPTGDASYASVEVICQSGNRKSARLCG